MNDTERKEIWKRDTDEIYRSIGAFVVKFEHVCHAVHVAIVFLLSCAGLQNQRVSQILLSGITAEPLRTLFESLVGEIQQLNDNERKIVKNALNRFQTLTQQRNDIIHSTWFVGWGNEASADFSAVSGVKFHKDQHGAAPKSFKSTAEDFDKLSQEAEVLASIFHRLYGCFVGGFSIENNFVITEGGEVHVPSGA